MALTERPHSYCFTKNDIRYGFTINNLTRPGLMLEVKLQYAPIGGNLTTLYIFSLKPNPNGSAYIYLQGYLHGLTKYVLPSLTSSVTNANAQLIKFCIHYREVTTADPNPLWITTEENNIRTAIKGGIEKHKAQRNNFFVNYWEVNKPFLTWQASNKMVLPNDTVYLTFLSTGTVLNIATTATDVNGTQIATNTPITTTANLYHIAINVANIVALSSNKLWYFEVMINNVNGVEVAARRYYINHNPHYTTYSLVCHNSLGGVDNVTVLGRVTHLVERTNVTAESGGNVGNWNSPNKAEEMVDILITANKVFKGDIGWHYSKPDQESMLELLLSRSIWQNIGNAWVPVLTIQKNVDLGVMRDDTMNFPIEWKLSEQNEVFTPTHITLGEGVDNEVY